MGFEDYGEGYIVGKKTIKAKEALVIMARRYQ